MRTLFLALLSSASAEESTLKLQRQDLVHIVEKPALPASELVALFQGVSDGWHEGKREKTVDASCLVNEGEVASQAITVAVNLFKLQTRQDDFNALKELTTFMKYALGMFRCSGEGTRFSRNFADACMAVRDANVTPDKRILILDLDITPELDEAISYWSTEKSKFGLHLGKMYHHVYTKTGVIGEAAIAEQQPEYAISKDSTVDDGEMKNELTEATDAWETQRYEDFSSQFGLVSDQTLIGGVDPQHIALWLVRGICDKFAQGYRAICLDLHLRCIREQWAPKIYLSFKEAANQYAAETEEGDLRALEELSSAMMLVQTLFFYCITSSPKVAIFSSSLRKAWETVKDPKNFAYTEKHITIKGVDITPELDKAMSFWSEKDYTGFGQQIGIMYYRVLTKTGVKGAAAVAVEEPALLIA